MLPDVTDRALLEAIDEHQEEIEENLNKHEEIYYRYEKNKKNPKKIKPNIS